MICIKTGFDIAIGDAIYRADLHLQETCGQLWAVVNREPWRTGPRSEVYPSGVIINYDDRINCKLSSEVTMTKAFLAKLVDINPWLSIESLAAHSIIIID